MQQPNTFFQHFLLTSPSLRPVHFLVRPFLWRLVGSSFLGPLSSFSPLLSSASHCLPSCRHRCPRSQGLSSPSHTICSMLHWHPCQGLEATWHSANIEANVNPCLVAGLAEPLVCSESCHLLSFTFCYSCGSRKIPPATTLKHCSRLFGLLNVVDRSVQFVLPNIPFFCGFSVDSPGSQGNSTILVESSISLARSLENSTPHA